MPMAPPPGSVLATAVDVSVTTAAWAYRMPGVPLTITSQYVTRFHRVATPSTSSSPHVIVRNCAQMADTLVNWGMKNQKMPTTIISDTTPDRTGRSQGRLAKSPDLRPAAASDDAAGPDGAAGTAAGRG